MKIFYAVQATGNGHISRAMELLPYLEQYGTVDIFLSGENSSLDLEAPVAYRSKGLSLFYSHDGSLDYWKMFRKFSPARIVKEVRALPVEKYDLVINDFECITSLACAYKKVPSVNFGHQASFHSQKVPRPSKRDRLGEWILMNYARATRYIGLHFDTYDDFIVTPVIKKDIWHAQPGNKGYFTVYLSSYSDQQLLTHFHPLKEYRFEVFSKEISTITTIDNVTLIPVNKEAFNKSLVDCEGILTGAGFETPAEAMYLQKKLMVIPIKGQYEQFCNAAALEQLGVPVIRKLDHQFPEHFNSWIQAYRQPALSFKYSTASVVNFLMSRSSNLESSLDMLYPELVFN